MHTVMVCATRVWSLGTVVILWNQRLECVLGSNVGSVPASRSVVVYRRTVCALGGVFWSVVEPKHSTEAPTSDRPPQLSAEQPATDVGQAVATQGVQAASAPRGGLWINAVGASIGVNDLREPRRQAWLVLVVVLGESWIADVHLAEHHLHGVRAVIAC